MLWGMCYELQLTGYALGVKGTYVLNAASVIIVGALIIPLVEWGSYTSSNSSVVGTPNALAILLSVANLTS